MTTGSIPLPDDRIAELRVRAEQAGLPIGHAAIETVLLLDGPEIVANVDAQEKVVMAVAEWPLNRSALCGFFTRELLPAPSGARGRSHKNWLRM